MGQACEEPKKIDPGAPKWVVTFGDLMSLLLCFFVLLLSFSELDRQKYKQVAGSLEKAFGVQRKTRIMEIPKGIKVIAKDFDQEIIATRIKEEIGREINAEIETRLKDFEDQLSVDAGDNQVVIRLMGESTFDSGKAEIRRELKPLLLKIGRVLNKTSGDIIVAGHTDNVPVRGGPYKSNLILSSARAAAVAEFLIKRGRVNPRRISTMGFGEFRPIASNATAEGRSKNRRVEIILGTIPVAQKQAEKTIGQDSIWPLDNY